MPKRTVKQNSTKQSSSTPSTRRANTRAKAKSEPIIDQGDDRATITPVVEIAPSLPPSLGRAVNHTARRMQSARIVDGEQPDAFVVDFLFNFVVDHRSDTGAERIPCGEVTGIEGIREEIQARFVPRLGPGYYRITPRVNGKITKGQWVEYVSAPGYVESDLHLDEIDDDVIEELSSDDPEKIRLQERLKYERRLNAERNGSGSISELLHGLRALDEMRGQSAPQKSLIEQIREAKETARELVDMAPRRPEPSAQTVQPAPDLMTTALKIIAENPKAADTVKDFVGLKRESESDPWADVAMKVVESGQLAPLVQAGASILGNIFSAILPKPAQTPAQQGSQHPAPAVQPTQAPPQVAPAETPALPANDQQPQPAQMEQGPMQMAPVDALVYSLIQLCEKQAPIADAQNIINIGIVRNPELGDSVDEILNLSVDQILALLAAYHPPVAQMPHARAWLESLINALTAEGGEFDEVTEINGGGVKL
jgi:hypothetical protein